MAQHDMDSRELQLAWLESQEPTIEQLAATISRDNIHRDVRAAALAQLQERVEDDEHWVAWERDERDSCQRSTPSCCVDHNRAPERECEGW